MTTTVSALSRNFGIANRKKPRDLLQDPRSQKTFRASAFSGSRGVSSALGRPPVVCHRCGKEGHFRSQCPQLQGTALPGTYYNRGKMGHISRNCP